MVRTDTSSSAASSWAVICPLACKSISMDSSRSARIAFSSEYPYFLKYTTKS